MDPNEFNDSLALDGNHHNPQESSQQADFNVGAKQKSLDSYEHHHPSHYEPLESVTGSEEIELSVFETARTRKESLVLMTNFQQAITEMKGRISLIERQLASASSNEDQAGVTDNISRKDSTRDMDVTFENGIKDRSDQRQMIPQLRDTSWSDFMNKRASDEDEYAIEVLVGEPEYRPSTKDIEKSDKKGDKERRLKPGSQNRMGPVSSGRVDNVVPIPERIRINSLWILNTLAGIDQTMDATGPIVMLRPFKFLIYHETQIKNSIRRLRNQPNGPGTMASDQSEVSLDPEPSAETDGLSIVSQNMEDRQVTFQHMQCLGDFIDRYIKPTIDRLENNSDGKIHFRDLWHIFKPGENIYMPSPETFQTRYNLMWRVTATGGGRPNISVAESRYASLKPNAFKVNCYYIDFNGKFFCPIIHTFSIMPFKGERDITSLDFFPVRFMKAAESTVSEHLKRGKWTFKSIASSFTHFYYKGPTLVVQPCGCPLQKDPLHQEHVESEVIVDFRMPLLKNPSWRPKAILWKTLPVEKGELQEKCTVRHWKGHGRTKLVNTEYDHVYDDSNIDRELAAAIRNKEQIFSPVPSGWSSNESVVPEKDFMLLAGRVYAFVLRTRTFAPLWLWLLQPIKPQTDGLRNLQLRDSTLKNTVQALVRTHFIQKIARKTSDFEYEVVRGKGKGLVILLHGAPGVGKTFTAESIAAANGKPLFQITCGDLGLTPGEVEKALKEIFHFAQLWNCVLLLDECDIFLTQRSKTDIKRNSLVSVFLRVLEFYTGVLFLTTNRVGVLDDAVKSRITWTAYYPPLDEQQTMNIWKVNIKLLEERSKHLEVDRKGIMRFAKEHFKYSVTKDSTWNGRQIQNAFKVATALAEWDAYSQDMQRSIDTKVPEEAVHTQPKLLPVYFNKIATGSQAFDQYLQEARGNTDAERAFNAMERVDTYATDGQTYDRGNFIVSQDNDRNPLSSPTYQPSSVPSWQRKSSSTTINSAQSYGREPSPLPPGHRRSPNPWKPQTSPSSSRHNLSNFPQPQGQRQRSSSQLAPAGASPDPQLQSLQSTRSISNVNHSHTTAVSAATTISQHPYPSSLTTKKKGRHLSLSNADPESQGFFNEDDDDANSWSEFGSDMAKTGDELDLGDTSLGGRDDGEEQRY